MIAQMFKRCTALLLLTFLTGLIGCGPSSDIDRYRVRGQVTFEGNDVGYGQITFQPDGSQGNNGPAGFATIVDGKFDTSRDGTDIVGGPHLVTINGYREDPQGAADADLVPLTLFSRYSTTHDFPRKASEVQFDIPAQAANAATSTGQ